MFETPMIALADILENPVALRSVDKDTEGYQGLVDSIKTRGVLNPIVVRPDKMVPGKFVLVDGLHRYSAAKDAGLTSIPVNVIDMTEGESMTAQIMANVHRVETKPVEYSKQLLRILASSPTLTQSQLAASLSKSTAWIGERLKLVKLEPSIAKLVDEGKITVVNGYTLAKLPPAEQLNYVEQAASMQPGEFAPTINQRLKEIHDAARQGKAAQPAEFQPVMHLRKLSELKEAWTTEQAIRDLIRTNEVSDPFEAAKLAIAWVLNYDPQSQTAQKAAHEARKAKLEADRKAREAERKAKKAEEAQKAAEEARANA